MSDRQTHSGSSERARPRVGKGSHPAQEANLLGHQLIRPQRFSIPHPLVAVAGAAGVFAIYLLGQARGWDSFLDYAPWLTGFLVAFSYISRRSARREALRRERDLEQLRKQPVWGLNQDGDRGPGSE